MEKIHELKIKYVHYMPKEKEHGILYISKEFSLAIHLCACGCGIETVTPFNDSREWILTEKEAFTTTEVTLRPSIGNFMGESPYHAHYYITENKIEWL